MATTIVRNGANQPIGRLEESGTYIRAYNQKGVMVGYYESKSNVTRDKNNSLFARGNRVTALIQ